MDNIKTVMDMCDMRLRYPEGIKTETKVISNVKLVSRQPVVVARFMDAHRLVAWLREHEILDAIYKRPHRAMVERSVGTVSHTHLTLPTKA